MSEVQKPTPEDMARDLAADLAQIDRHRERWMVPLMWRQTTKYAFPEWQDWQDHLPLVAEAAIRRARAAEAECAGWRNTSAADAASHAAAVTAWKVEKARREGAEAESLRLREALCWAVGFVRCHHPQNCEGYPDFRNAAALAEGGPNMHGPFHSAVMSAEVAEADLAELRKEAAWVRRKLGIPEGTPFLTGGGDTLAGTLHVLCSHAHGYDAYIAAYRCDDKQGEIARLAVRAAEAEDALAELAAKHERAVAHGTDEESRRYAAETRVAELEAENSLLALRVRAAESGGA